MKNIFRIVLLAAFFSTNYMNVFAQLASGDAFLQGKYVEVGVAPNGNYGSRFNAPSGYHGRSMSLDASIPAAIGFIADPNKDGWGVGAPTFVGDYFMPANPWIGWGIEIDGTRYLANRQTSATTFSAGLTGSNTDYYITGKLKHTIWTGTVGDISILQDTYLDTNSLYFVSKLKLKNTGATTALNIYYLQTVNPDNDYANFAANLNTKDTIVFQNPNVDNKALIVARGSSSNSYLGLGTKDCRAQVFRGPLNNTDVTLTSSFASVYDFTRPSHNFSGGFPSGNSSIGIIFKIDSLKAGDSTVFAYTYILGQAYLDSAFLQIKSNFLYSGVQYNSGDTLSACPGAVLPVTIQNGESFNYTWTPVSGLATTSGYANSITVGTSTVTYRAVGTGIYSNCTNNDTLYLNIKPITLPAAPTVTTPVNLCVGGPSATLTATGTSLKWYTASSGGTALAGAPTITTGTASTATYYVSQSLSAASGGCEGTSRAAIVANVNALPAAPTVTTPVNLCVGGPSATLSATGTNLKWYTASSGGTALASAPTITTGAASTATYYVSQSLSAASGGCEGGRSAIAVNVNALPAAPIVTTPVNLCVGGPGTTLTATGTNLNWYIASSGGTPLASAPTITTGSASTATYYVSQSLSAASGGCEGTLRAAIVANVNDLPAAPTVTTPVNLCVGGPSATLTATGTNLKWYTASSGGTALASAPTITTGTASTATYYVSQSLSAASGGCEGTARAAIVANVNALPAAPTVTTPVNLCVGGLGTTLTATGTNLKWYTVASGGSPLASAPIISTASASAATYYVSQSLAVSAGGCEGGRSAIAVNVNALPAAPIVTTPVNLCVGGPGTTLTATGTNLNWYIASSGGTPLASAPTITTGSASTATYYVSQSLSAASGGCEGTLRAAIVANVNDLPAAPTVSTPVNLCVGGPGTTLTATGTTLKWYTAPSGGTALASAPTITTGTASTATYYVSQSLAAASGGCEGTARATMVANVNALPLAPTVATPLNLCIGGADSTLTAIGTNLKWYTVATGGVGLSTAPKITPSSTGSSTYYVSSSLALSSGACEGVRATISVNVQPLPTLLISPVGVPDFVYCDSRSVKLLGTSPTAVSYQWAFEGVSIPTATMDTLSAGKSGYFSLMVKNVFGCIRIDSVLVKPTPFPTPILSPTEVQMCDGTDIMLYSSPAAAGYTYQWFKDGLPMGIPLIETKTPVSLTGNYQVIITDIYTCVKSTNLSSVSTYAPVPKPIVLRTGTLLTLDKPFTKYQWYRNNKIIAGATMRNYTMAFDGAYYAKVWDVNGCENYSDTLQSNSLAINGLKSSSLNIRIYPNPTTDILYIETPVNVLATLCDALGKKQLEVKNASSISLKSLADAMYILYLHDDEGSLIGSYKILKTEP